ncbi:MAG: phage portal protein [Oscillospiraceae bacterium]
MGLKDWLLGRGGGTLPAGIAGSYTDIRRWEDIYNGGGDWRYTRKGGINGGTRRVASLGAARALCGELSRLCFTEGTAMCFSDPDTERFVNRVLKESRFAERFPEFLEKVFALGGGVIKVYFAGNSDGSTGIRVDLVTADCFVPTGWNSREITGGAFASRIMSGGKSYILAESQQLDGGALVTENRLYREDGAKADIQDILPGLQERSRIEGMSSPLFVYLSAGATRRTVNPGECPLLGSSVFAGAEDTLKEIDTVFDSLGREFLLGKKRIIVPAYAVRGEWDSDGNKRHYFDVNDEVFQAMSTSDAEELKITDNTGELRVTEHIQALGELLDLLCMQAGLSEGALSYKDGTIRTAAEVVSRNSRTYRTQACYRRMISEALSRMAQNICILGKMAGELPDRANDSASAVFADGAAEDDGTRTDRAVKLYTAGVISRARALSQIYGISLEEAQAMERTDFNG